MVHSQSSTSINSLRVPATSVIAIHQESPPPPSGRLTVRAVTNTTSIAPYFRFICKHVSSLIAAQNPSYFLQKTSATPSIIQLIALIQVYATVLWEILPNHPSVPSYINAVIPPLLPPSKDVFSLKDLFILTQRNRRVWEEFAKGTVARERDQRTDELHSWKNEDRNWSHTFKSACLLLISATCNWFWN